MTYLAWVILALVAWTVVGNLYFVFVALPRKGQPEPWWDRLLYPPVFVIALPIGLWCRYRRNRRKR